MEVYETWLINQLNNLTIKIGENGINKEVLVTGKS